MIPPPPRFTVLEGFSHLSSLFFFPPVGFAAGGAQGAAPGGQPPGPLLRPRAPGAK